MKVYLVSTGYTDCEDESDIGCFLSWAEAEKTALAYDPTHGDGACKWEKRFGNKQCAEWKGTVEGESWPSYWINVRAIDVEGQAYSLEEIRAAGKAIGMDFGGDGDDGENLLDQLTGENNGGE